MRISPRCTGAMKDRLGQLAENARSSKLEPKAGKPQFDDPNDTALFEALAAEANGRKFDQKHQQEIGYTKIPSYASQGTRNLALSMPWQGSESPFAVTARTKVIPKTMKDMKPQLKRRATVQDRLLSARENSLDYKLNRDAPEDSKLEKDPMFSQLYRDRFLSSGGTSMSFIESIASQRIEDAYSRNEFKNIPRGEKTKHDFRSSSPFIDTTEYFLNKMIQKQGAAPPWVEKQIKVNQSIKNMRSLLLNSWSSRAMALILDKYVHTVSDVEKKMEMSAEISHKISTDEGAEQWKQENRLYHEELLKDLNSAIRGYNLQAPGSARKHYIDLEKELISMFEKSPKLILEKVRGHLIKKKSQIVAANIHLHESTAPTERAENHYGLRSFIKDLFGKNEKNGMKEFS